ncbi:hypothetical protein O181_008637 [Austropuccinia psidii MF-1]|uniref:Uncharacterized protein n=1 Tax=Austropuccinia psidii MF-1 TaxID=1389203 RepID=A0A9Q3BP61_9BASI|nr:hypothetical protein [Austropuccinia psidii MF-1]
MTPGFQKEPPVEFTSSKPAPQQSKNKTKGPRTNHGKANWHRPYPQGYRIPKLEPLAMDKNAFESAIFNSDKDKPLTLFLKQKYGLSALHPDISDSMIDKKIFRKCGGESEHAIKFRFVEPCQTEDYINAMEDIITRKRTGKAWTRNPMESKIVPKTFK